MKSTTEIRAAAEKCAREYSPNWDAVDVFKMGAQFILDSLRAPNAGDEAVLATADICPHGGSSSLCEWCGYKAQVGHLLSERAKAAGEIEDYREALEKFVGNYGIDFNTLFRPSSPSTRGRKNDPPHLHKLK